MNYKQDTSKCGQYCHKMTRYYARNTYTTCDLYPPGAADGEAESTDTQPI